MHLRKLRHRSRATHRRCQIAAELLDEIDRDAGMDAPLPVEELGLVVQRYDRSVPHIGMQVQAAATLAPERQKLFWCYFVSRQRQRHHETLPVEGIEELTAVGVIVRAPDQGALTRSAGGPNGGLFRPIAPAEQVAVAHRVVSRVQGPVLPAKLEQTLGHAALIDAILVHRAPRLGPPAYDLDRECLRIVHKTAVAFETGIGREHYRRFMRPPHAGGWRVGEFQLIDIHDAIVPSVRTLFTIDRVRRIRPSNDSIPIYSAYLHLTTNLHFTTRRERHLCRSRRVVRLKA